MGYPLESSDDKVMFCPWTATYWEVLSNENDGRMMQNKKGEEEEEIENQGFGDKIGFDFNTKEITFPLSTSPYNDLNHKARL